MQYFHERNSDNKRMNENEAVKARNQPYLGST